MGGFFSARRMRACLHGMAVAFGLTGLALFPAVAQELDEGPVLVTADEMTYEQNNAIVRARGNVEIISGDRILLADELTYDQLNDTVVAIGNVSVTDTDGTVVFADRVELSDHLREGAIQGFRALLSDESRLVAESAERVGGNRTSLNDAVYSPCDLCADNPERAPLWQLRAEKVTHDQAAQEVIYRNARLEVYGVPVVYTPYFSHADPSVKRRSGFLAPSFQRSSVLGFAAETPYYYAINPSIDLTVSPKLTTDEGPIMSGEFRQRTQTGRYELRGTITYPDQRNQFNQRTGRKDERGYIKGNGEFDYDNTWAYGFNLHRATDDTFLRRYRISNEDTLTSRAYVEGINGRSYAAVNSYAFQGLRANDDPGQTPLILPTAEYAHVGVPGRYGSFWRFDANALMLTRNEGTDSRRISTNTRYQIPYYGSLGEVVTFAGELRADGYLVNDVRPDPMNPLAGSQEGFVGRAVPQASVDWRLPFVRHDATAQHVVEPIVVAVVSPNGGNPAKIPNEDSFNFEFDDTNVFSTNRFPGYDRLEGGSRLNYGVKYGIYGDTGYYASALVGQILRSRADDTFAQQTGLESNSSDFVGRFDFSPNELIQFFNRYRLDRDSLSIRRNELGFDLGNARHRLNLTYVSLARELTADELTSREEVAVYGQTAISRYWSVTGRTRRDLTEERGGTINYGLGLIYEDECFTTFIEFEREFTSDRDVEPSTSVSVRIRLKNLS